MQFFCIPKKLKRVKEIITTATGPLVKIANPKNNQGVIQIEFLSLANVLQKDNKLIPTVEQRRESLTAALLHIMTNGDNAKPTPPIMARIFLLLDFWGQQYNVSAIISINNNDESAEGSLAEREPKLSQVEFPGSE